MSRTLTYTPVENIPKIHATAHAAFNTGRTQSIPFRKEQLAQLGWLLKDNEDRLRDALHADLGRPSLETDMIDLNTVYADIKIAYDSVEKWVKPQRVPFHPKYFVMSPAYAPQPKGVALLIAPFNVPLFLLIGPLVGAIAAGSAAVLKPSEQIPATSQLLAELIPKYLDPELYQVINGAVAETTKALELRWDHILYTGNGRVGRIVAAAAAKHLTPITLELGGKNPVVFDPKVDLKMAARRLLWGRFTNGGQICLCPEYVLVPAEFQDTLVEALKEAYNSFYPDGPEKSDSITHIVTEAHTLRIKRLIDETKGTIVTGGKVDVPTRFVAPTIVRDVALDDVLMADEIFGPVLPIVPVKDVDEAISIIRSREHPLAVYVFSQDKAFKEKVFRNTRSGAAVVNESVLTAGIPGLPVGGVGESGYGFYGGKFAFDTFSYLRASIDNPSWVDKLFSFRFPPYKPDYKKYLGTISLPPRPSKGKAVAKASAKRWGFWLLFALVGASSVVKVLTKSGRVSQLKRLA